MATPEIAERPARARDGNVRPLRVLVVEDDDDLREAIREVFLMRGFIVDTARDGLAASQHSFTETYDVVVSDLRMPEMGGLELLWILKNVPRPPQVILITAYPDWIAEADGIGAGACQVMYKPFALVKLAQAVEKAAARGESEN